VRRDPPRLGADTAALLAGLGYTDGEIDGLRTRAVVA
jgi:crotonobetainyl-CoA:carnitine CoA-transferase CaiB-like acyl-CoA transferase